MNPTRDPNVSHWDPNVSQWDPIVSHWDPTGIPPGIPLYPTGIPLGSHWDPNVSHQGSLCIPLGSHCCPPGILSIFTDILHYFHNSVPSRLHSKIAMVTQSSVFQELTSVHFFSSKESINLVQKGTS